MLRFIVRALKQTQQRPFLTCLIVFFACNVIVQIVANVPSQAGPYSVSAHGDTTYGVNRTVLATEGYVTGNCAHCHEQHASVAGTEPTPALGVAKFCLMAENFSGKTLNTYSDSDNVCFYCHSSLGSLQSGGISNDNYSATFGGATATTSGILQAFNQNAYHNLYDLQRYITGVSGSKTFTSFPADSNPCSGCHNIHIAKRNKENTGDPTYSAISKPSDHDNLWGVTTPDERMSALSYGTAYQPPYYYGSTALEPDGASTLRATQAEKTPDYNAFCTDCHNSTNTIYSTTLTRNLRTIDWDVEKHGKGNADTYINVDLPFTAGSSALGYILTCTDCHEPHGSPNAFLIRPAVNGASLGATISSFSDTNMLYLCARCHEDNNQQIHHSLNDYPYTAQQCGTCHTGYPMACTNCHYHGSVKTNCRTPATRLTF